MKTRNLKENNGSRAFCAAFGVGSWEFGLRMCGSFHINVSEYCSRLKSELETISSLTDLEIIADEDDTVGFNEEHLQNTRFGTAVFPGHTVFRIRFILYIPLRIQNEILGPYFADGIGTEKFVVHNHFQYYGTISYVELIDADKCRSPSTAVRLVREYLRTQLDIISSKLVFRFVGPSPFHGDFWIEADNTLSQGSHLFSCETVEDEGYNKLKFRCCGYDFQSKDDACKQLFEDLDAELDFFYQIHRNNEDQYDQWKGIELAVSKLSKKFNTRTRMRRFGVRFDTGVNISHLQMDLALFEAEHIQRRHYEDKEFMELYSREKPVFLKSFVQLSLSSRPLFATKQMKEVVTFIEARRTKAIEWTVLIAAGLVGGITGSIVTLLVK